MNNKNNFPYNFDINACSLFPFWNKFKKNQKKILEECPGISLK